MTCKHAVACEFELTFFNFVQGQLGNCRCDGRCKAAFRFFRCQPQKISQASNEQILEYLHAGKPIVLSSEKGFTDHLSCEQLVSMYPKSAGVLEVMFHPKHDSSHCFEGGKVDASLCLVFWKTGGFSDSGPPFSFQICSARHKVKQEISSMKMPTLLPSHITGSSLHLIPPNSVASLEVIFFSHPPMPLGCSSSSEHQIMAKKLKLSCNCHCLIHMTRYPQSLYCAHNRPQAQFFGFAKSAIYLQWVLVEVCFLRRKNGDFFNDQKTSLVH